MASSWGQPQLVALALDFLSDAAHLLHGAAPATSAHLLRHRAGLALHNNVAQHGLERQHVCAACGSIMVPGLGATTAALRAPAGPPAKARARARRAKKARGGEPKPASVRRHAPAPAPEACRELTCGRCRRVTRLGLGPRPPAAAAARRRTAKLLPPAAAAAASSSSSSKAAANATSKRRAKNRKGGLQALLAGQQQRSAPSLSLADFGAK